MGLNRKAWVNTQEFVFVNLISAFVHHPKLIETVSGIKVQTTRRVKIEI